MHSESGLKKFVGDRLKELRAKTGQTQDVIAAAIGIEKSTYGNYEAGRRLPDFSMLCRLARFYRVSVSYFDPDAQPWEQGMPPVPLDLEALLLNHKELRLYGKPVTEAARHDLLIALRAVYAAMYDKKKARIAGRS